MEIAGKSVLVTGASGGIGLAVAQRLAGSGARVTLAARNEAALVDAAAQLRDAPGEVQAVRCDVTNDEDVVRAVKAATDAFGGLDIVCNNAGRAIHSPVAALDLEAWQTIVDLDLYGPVRVMKAAVPVMRANGGGVILNVSSGTARNVIPNLGGYASLKAALDLLTRTARLELAADNIRVLLIWPGRTATDFGRNALRLEVPGAPAPPRRPGAEPDTAEAVAERICWQIDTEEPETAMGEPVRA